MHTALVLYSGGLDSRLAIKIMQDAGAAVIAFHALHAFAGKENAATTRARVERECRALGATDVIFAVTTDKLVALLWHNRFGLGKNLNPCIDCRLMTITTAAALMEKVGADFLATGEVLGQRPKSQQRFGLDAVYKNLPPAAQGRLVRPLCAKLLSPTLPEINGWIDREKLYAISGRSRAEQIALAAKFQIGDYPNPAGGCLLTDAGFAERLRNLRARQPEITEADLELLKVGRQLITETGAQIVIARDSNEGDVLEKLVRPDDLTFITTPLNGALVLLRGRQTAADEIAAQRAAIHYSKYRGAEKVEILRLVNGVEKLIIASV